MQFLSPTRFRILAQEFKSLRIILHLNKAFDKPHIPIIVLVIRKEKYYYQKISHLGLLQSVVDTKFIF